MENGARAYKISCYEGLTKSPNGARLVLPTTKGLTMAIFEFSDGFDAQGWYMEQMSKGHFEDDFDYGDEG